MATPETTDVVRMAGLIRMLSGQREFERGERKRGWDQQTMQDELDWFRGYWSNAGLRESMPCLECGGKMDDDGDGEKCHLCCEYPNSRGSGSDSNVASASKCKVCELQHSAHLGQVYGYVASIRTIVDEASDIAGLCLEQRHVDDLQALAGMADRMCKEIATKWDAAAGKPSA